jgi:AsmA protein
MARLLKLIGIVVGAVVVLLVVAGLALSLFFDPNDYKDEISAAVANATGRELTLSGDLELEVFPRLRIAVGSAELSNAPGFGDAPFASIDSARLQLGLLALLGKRISIGEATLEGLRLNLARNAAGTGNWQDLGGGSSEPAGAGPAPSASGGAALDLDVGAVEVADAEVQWHDAATGQEWSLTDFNLEASGFGPGERFPLSIAFGLAGAEVEVAVSADMQATLALAENRYQLDDLDVRIEGSGPGWPGGEGAANVSFDSFVANLDAQTVDLDGLRLRMLGLDVSGSLEGRQLFSNLALAGAIDIAEFDPHDVIDEFGMQIETADADVFRRASAHADLTYDSSRMGLSNMQLALDDSTLTGSIGMQGDTLRFALDVDSIDIDRYLPPATEGASTPEEGSIDEVDLPLDPLRTFKANGTLALRETNFIGLSFSDASFALTAANGTLKLTPKAALYGGSIEGSVGIEVRGDSANFSLVQKLQNVDLYDFARDFLETEDLSGTGNVDLNLTASGSNLGAIRRGLDGDASFTLRDGAWEGFDAWYEMRRARAVIDKNPVPQREGTPRTEFSSVAASGKVTDAVLATSNLNATLPFMRVDGTGTVNLLSDAIDFQMTASFIDGPVLQSDPAMAGMLGQRLPLKVGGTLAEPSILPDFAAIVRERARSEANEAIEEKKEEVQDRLRDRLRGILDR